MRIPSVLIAVLWAVLAVGPALAAEHGKHNKPAPHGEAWVQKTVKVCEGCHGPNGVSQTPRFPIIAGQYKTYLYHALKAYRDGIRESAIMSAQVKGMTNAQLEALATYFSRQESPLYTPSIH